MSSIPTVPLFPIFPMFCPYMNPGEEARIKRIAMAAYDSGKFYFDFGTGAWFERKPWKMHKNTHELVKDLIERRAKI